MHHKKELQELMRTYSSMKALQLLVALADCEGEISLAQLFAATGIPPSSVGLHSAVGKRIPSTVQGVGRRSWRGNPRAGWRTTWPM